MMNSLDVLERLRFAVCCWCCWCCCCGGCCCCCCCGGGGGAIPIGGTRDDGLPESSPSLRASGSTHGVPFRRAVSKWLALHLFLLPELKISQFDRSARPMGNMWSPSHAGMGVADLADQRRRLSAQSPAREIRGALLACFPGRELCSALLCAALLELSRNRQCLWGDLDWLRSDLFLACRSRGTESPPGSRVRLGRRRPAFF